MSILYRRIPVFVKVNIIFHSHCLRTSACWMSSLKRRRRSRLCVLPRRRRGRCSPRRSLATLFCAARQYTPAARRGAPTLIDDNCPLPPRGADPYIGCMRHSHESPRRSREGGNLASQLHADDKECNEMQPNATVLKVSPLLVTRDEANVATNEATPAQCLRVNGVPNEATLASFPASTLGVNGAKTPN